MIFNLFISWTISKLVYKYRQTQATSLKIEQFDNNQPKKGKYCLFLNKGARYRIIENAVFS